jgi:hypothetical protein
MHVKCFKTWKRGEFIKKLQISISLLEKSREEATNRLVSLLETKKIRETELHEIIKKEVADILASAKFLTRTEVWVFDKRKEVYRVPLIDYMIEGKYPSYLSRLYGELPRIDLVALLSYLKYREPSFLFAVEISITSFQKDIEKLKNADVFDAKVIFTPQKVGKIDNIFIANVQNFVDIVINMLYEFYKKEKIKTP